MKLVTLADRRLARFLASGGLAALVNLGSRYLFSLILSFEWSVAAAYGCGMLTAWLLARRYVFDDSGHHWTRELARFAVVNVFSGGIVWIVSVALARWVLPLMYSGAYAEGIAHFCGVIAPVLPSYVAHKYFTFARKRPLPAEPIVEAPAATAPVMLTASAHNAEINRRVQRGIKAMMSRQVLTQVLTFFGGILLARHLVPADFGLYTIATFFVQTVAQFGSFGLAASLVQRRNELEERDLVVAFTLQQLAIGTIVLLLILAAPLVPQLYPHAPPGLDWLIRAMSVTLFLTSWRTMSELQIERQLGFDKLAVIEVTESLIYQGMAVALALSGFGVWSLVAALLVKSVVGAALAYWVAPWPLRFGWDRKLALDILRFGLPFQLTSLLNSAGGWITPLLVGPLIGPQAVGYLGWAAANGKKPLLLVDSVMRVAFPHFARLQDQPDEVERMMQRYLGWLLVPSALWFTLLVTAGPPLVALIYTAKWLPAVTALLLSAAAVALDCIVWLVGQTQNALGLIRLALVRAGTRSGLNIALSIPLVLWLGYDGVPIAYIVALLLSLPLTFNGLRRGAIRRTLGPQAWIAVPTAAGCAAGLLVRRVEMPLLWSGLVIATVSGLVFLAVCTALAPGWMRETVFRRLRLAPQERVLAR
jgi:O-antigen/teichoic acid export membrane protein